MFKIKFLRLFSANKMVKEYEFDVITYVFGDNSHGKTLLAKSLDYVLGSTENMLINNIEGLEEITALSCVLIDDNRFVEFVRNKNGEYYIKYDINSEYSLVDDKKYKETLSELFTNIDKNKLSLYYELNNNYLTCRALSFMNFLDETGIGNISTVFTRANEKKHIFRVKDIMDFIFKFEFLKKLKNKEKELENLEIKYKNISTIVGKIDYAKNIIKDVYAKYGIKYTSLDENYNRFLTFKGDFKIEISTGKKQNLFKLMELLNKVENQILIETQLKNQSEILVEKNEKVNNLLNDFAKILSGSEKYTTYIEKINDIFSSNKYSSNILMSKNYDATIRNLNDEKDSILEKINNIRNSLSGFSLNEKLVDIQRLNDSFSVLKSNDSKDATFIIDQIKDTKKEIKKLNTIIKEFSNPIINEIITKLYLDNDLKVGFVDEDRNKRDFKILFDTSRLSINCYYKLESNGDYVDKFFVPGSLARMTTMQVATYISMHKYIKDNSIGLPLMPFICIDGLNQPFDNSDEKNNYKNVLKLLMKYAQESNLQIIVISTDYDDSIESVLNEYNAKIIKLQNGFNPLHHHL